jgi:hypothetical protein
MRLTSTRIAILTLAALLLGGCAKHEATEHEHAATTPATSDSSEAAVPHPQDVAGDAAVPAEIQLAGTLGCGHCTFHVTSECAAVLRTASGESYVLDGVEETSELWAKRMESGHKITVSGKLVGTDAVKHIAMTSFEID